MAGLVTEYFQHEFVGAYPWKVPIFLFRQHEDVEKYLWALHHDKNRRREVYGRHGTDFIGIALNDLGEIERFIAGEAKWRANLSPSVIAGMLKGPKERDEHNQLVHNGRGIWFEINRDPPIPHGLRQLQRLLEARDPHGHASAILSIDRAVLRTGPVPERTNLVLIVGNALKNREERTVLIPWEELPTEYTAPYDLQVVEIILEEGESLIDGLYTSLWCEK
ncbi:hypothetical protein Hrubri_1738 [Herbaspirillum rubrisubalbicans M1]|uniref:aminotransferase n=1 Tax=Herbaspirillum rubrisubalbicans TaxID=80842 RepID=UPI00073AA85D|nr:aminotransferase [Herbaspirillum rubrisubalbicans]ALU88943.1 hypothetical protein Hrubri_1738 [Herbaspirillum rubrisubalbicans M1]